MNSSTGSSRPGAEARTRARPSACAGLGFVGFPVRYDDPPGGSRLCLNTKLAACELTLERAGRPARTFSTRHRAAFEILTGSTGHGVPIAA